MSHFRYVYAWLLLSAFAILVPAAVRADAPPLRQLPEFSSVNGVLNATFDLKPQTIDLGDGVSFEGYTYNGEYAGPVLRVHPGDVMHIKLTNNISDMTNLHFHGLHTSPLENGDNIYIQVKPGDSFDYEVKIAPTQSPGLYWYHPHIHGISERLVNGGLSGMLIVDGFEKQFPEMDGIKVQAMIVKEYAVEETKNPAIARLHRLVQTINGQLLSSISMHKGETQLWQIANPGANDFFHLSLKGHTFRVVGRDGVSTNQETIADRIDLGPASRVEVLVDAGEQPGSYDLVSEQTPTGLGADKTDSRVLANVVVDGEGTSVPVSHLTSFPAKPDLTTQKITNYRTFAFTENALKGEYYINGKLFDHERIDTRVPVGATEEWTIRNDSDDTHVFHIHQMHFQVVEINGKPQPFDGYLDTVRVPERGEVRLLMPFTDPEMVGQFIYHCHVLEHEDKGMMANIEVYDPKKENFFLGLLRNYVPQLRNAGRICGARTLSFWDKLKTSY